MKGEGQVEIGRSNRGSRFQKEQTHQNRITRPLIGWKPIACRLPRFGFLAAQLVVEAHVSFISTVTLSI
jgi:hypothetical protein